MKRKLELNKQTVRILTDLSAVHGGWIPTSTENRECPSDPVATCGTCGACTVGLGGRTATGQNC